MNRRVRRAAPFVDRIAALVLTGADILALHGVEVYRGGRGNLLIKCPFHSDDNPSFSVRGDDGRGHCFSCGARVGDILALHRALGAFGTMGAALADLESRVGLPIPELHVRRAPACGRGDKAPVAGMPECVATWDYTNATGVPAFEIRRIQYRLPDGSWFHHPGAEKPHKIYLPSAPGGTPTYLPEPYKSGALRPLYRLPEVLAANNTTTIYVVEGEPAADALRSIGWTATTSSGGSSAATKTDWSPLAGRHVVVWPDNDDAGVHYASVITDLLRDLSPRVITRWIDVAALGLDAGGDAVDWLKGEMRHV